MAGCRRYVLALGLALGLQAVAYGANLDVLRAWPTPGIWFGLLLTSAAATIGAAVWPSRETFALASFASLTTVSMRIVEVSYGLGWGRLVGLPEQARATAWVALTRDVTLLVTLFVVWALVIRACAERGADATHSRRPAWPGRRRAVADSVVDVRRDSHPCRHGGRMARQGVGPY